VDLRKLFCCFRAHRVISEEEATYRGDDAEGDGFDSAISSINFDRTRTLSEMCDPKREMSESDRLTTFLNPSS